MRKKERKPAKEWKGNTLEEKGEENVARKRESKKIERIGGEVCFTWFQRRTGRSGNVGMQ